MLTNWQRHKRVWEQSTERERVKARERAHYVGRRTRFGKWNVSKLININKYATNNWKQFLLYHLRSEARFTIKSFFWQKFKPTTNNQYPNQIRAVLPKRNLSELFELMSRVCAMQINQLSIAVIVSVLLFTSFFNNLLIDLPGRITQ